jgi:5-methylcytosine-specific restriction protein A
MDTPDRKRCAGCQTRIPRAGPSRCSGCESARQRDHDARSSRERGFYHTTRWRQCRDVFLRANPLCVDCLATGRTEPATDPDHITPLADGGPPFDPANLRPLCHRCHSRRTIRAMNRKRRPKHSSFETLNRLGSETK